MVPRGVCLETQSLPDGPNRQPLHPPGGGDADAGGDAQPTPYPTGVLRPGERYRHVTVYRFGVSRDSPASDAPEGGQAT